MKMASYKTGTPAIGQQIRMSRVVLCTLMTKMGEGSAQGAYSAFSETLLIKSLLVKIPS